jgi:mycoredoxin
MDDIYNLLPSQIVMYSTQVCSDCLRAKAFFEANNISFLQIVIEEDPQAMEFVSGINRGFQSVPTIIFPDGSILREPSWEELRKKINK